MRGGIGPNERENIQHKKKIPRNNEYALVPFRKGNEVIQLQHMEAGADVKAVTYNNSLPRREQS